MQIVDELARVGVEARAQNWCTLWACTTCGSNDLRFSLQDLIQDYGAESVARGMQDAGYEFSEDALEYTLRTLSILLSPERLLPLLGPSPSANFLQKMLAERDEALERAHNAALNSARAAAAKAVVKNQAQLERGIRKAERDAEYRFRHSNSK